MFFCGTDAPAVFVCIICVIMCHWLLLYVHRVVGGAGWGEGRWSKQSGGWGSFRGSEGQMWRIHQTHSARVTGETHTLWMKDG